MTNFINSSKKNKKFTTITNLPSILFAHSHFKIEKLWQQIGSTEIFFFFFGLDWIDWVGIWRVSTTYKYLLSNPGAPFHSLFFSFFFSGK